jgi:hypothetical protein
MLAFPVCGRSFPALSPFRPSAPGGLALTLLVALVRANNTDNALAANHFAVLAHSLDCRLDLHRSSLV